MSVAISYVEGSHLIFDAKGVHLRDKLFPSGPSTLVVLQDSFSLAPVPYQLYRPTAGTYVVHASSPQFCRYKTFLKNRAPAVFVMTPWRREELAALLYVVVAQGGAFTDTPTRQDDRSRGRHHGQGHV